MDEEERDPKAIYRRNVIWAEKNPSENSYQSFLYAVNPDLIDREAHGKYLVLDNELIACEDDAFVHYDLNAEDWIVLSRVNINQTKDGIDTEDRIIKYREYLEKRLRKRK